MRLRPRENVMGKYNEAWGISAPKQHTGRRVEEVR